MLLHVVVHVRSGVVQWNGLQDDLQGRVSWLVSFSGPAMSREHYSDSKLRLWAGSQRSDLREAALSHVEPSHAHFSVTAANIVAHFSSKTKSPV